MSQPTALVFPSLTPERLYILDKRGRDWNTHERELQESFERSREYRVRRLAQIDRDLEFMDRRRETLLEEKRRLTSR